MKQFTTLISAMVIFLLLIVMALSCSSPSAEPTQTTQTSQPTETKEPIIMMAPNMLGQFVMQPQSPNLPPCYCSEQAW